MTFENDGETVTKYFLGMSPAEVIEREQLNIANTASALRARVIAHHAKGNGHNEFLGPITRREFG